jgi:hypothetical protein
MEIQKLKNVKMLEWKLFVATKSLALRVIIYRPFRYEPGSVRIEFPLSFLAGPIEKIVITP